MPAHRAHTTVKSQDARLHDTLTVVFWVYCLKMQNMIVGSYVMFYYRTICPYLFILYMILILHLNVPDNNDNRFEA